MAACAKIARGEGRDTTAEAALALGGSEHTSCMPRTAISRSDTGSWRNERREKDQRDFAEAVVTDKLL
jgi:hypothetical protein